MYGRSCDDVSTEMERAEDYLDKITDLTADVIIFPFSISEVPVSDTKDPENQIFREFCFKLAGKIRKDDVFIMTTIRKQDGISGSDLERVEVIKEVMEENGFDLKEEISEQDEETAAELIYFPYQDESDTKCSYPSYACR